MNSNVRIDLPVIDAERPVSREYNDEDLRAKFGPYLGQDRDPPHVKTFADFTS